MYIVVVELNKSRNIEVAVPLSCVMYMYECSTISYFHDLCREKRLFSVKLIVNQSRCENRGSSGESS